MAKEEQPPQGHWSSLDGKPIWSPALGPGEPGYSQDLRRNIAEAIEQHPSDTPNNQGETPVGHEDTSKDSTAYTFLDYTGLGLILMPTEELGRRWMDELPITRHAFFAAGTIMVAGAVVLALSKAIKRSKTPKGPLFQDFVKLTQKAWFWVLIAILIIFGVPLTIGYVSTPAVQVSEPRPTMLCADGPCTPPQLKPSPIYLKEIAIGADPTQQLMMQGISAVTTDRLRVFVDYSQYRSGWMPKIRAFIGEIKEPVKDQSERLQLINVAKMPNGGNNELWWGKPEEYHYVAYPDISGVFPVDLVRVRVVIVGPTGEEQHHYFLLMHSADAKQYKLQTLRDYELGDWITQWEAEK